MPPLVEITLAVALLAFTAMMLGLLVSALVRKEEVTMPLLVLLAIVQVVFCGALLKLDGVPGMEQLSWLVPSRWALARDGGHRRSGPDRAGRADRRPAVRALGRACGCSTWACWSCCRSSSAIWSPGCCAGTNPPSCGSSGRSSAR